MRIAVLRELAAGERRVALTPDAVKRLAPAHEVRVERGAGEPAGFDDAGYEEVGAKLAETADGALDGAELVLVVRPPAVPEVERMPRGAALIGFLDPLASPELVEALAAREILSFSMELIPRTTLAQRMDALSSQATVAGYKCALVAADRLGKFMPMLTTAAGTVPPAKVFVLGAGVAGLMAIATARRLGGVVEAFDIRPVVKEQVESLGARFVGETLEEAETAGGYAKEVTEETKQQEQALLAKHIAKSDIVITTAQVPGRRAPLLITTEMISSMQRGSVIIDLAAESGGNVEGSVPGQEVSVDGVVLIGMANVPSLVATHASQMYSRNVLALLEHLTTDGALSPDFEEEITRGCCVTRDGEVVHPAVRERAAAGA